MDTSKSYQNKILENNKKILEYQKLINDIEKENFDYEKKIKEEEEKKVNFNLNEQQKEAVYGNNSNSIIIACPGSGKTHTLISKVVHLIKNKDVEPHKIVMITFTKKASQEMNERLSKKLGFGNKLLHIGTLHGLAYRTLQKYDKINYTILDETDSNKIIHSVLDKLLQNEYKDKYSLEIQSLLYKKVLIIYNLTISKYPIKLEKLLESLKLQDYYDVIKKTLDGYDKLKKESSYLDFNDLMIYFLKFLSDERSAIFRESIDYILFDEYQDINSIQDMILKKMNNDCQNLTVVGDDAQSIYAFRGSEVKYIMNFNGSYNNVQTFWLEKNYRSTPEIIDFCNNIIKNNNSQLKKNMLAIKNHSLLKPKITGFATISDEVKYIVYKIKQNVKIGMKLRDQVIITRKNRQLDNFELELIKNKISYIKSKGVGLMDRIHIKDFLAFIVVMVNSKSIIHWKRILHNVPGIGNVTINNIINLKVNLMSFIKEPRNYINTRITKLLKPITELFIKLEDLYNKKKYLQISDSIINYLSPIIQKNMRAKEQTTFEEKIEDLETFKNYLVNYDNLLDFLADIHLTIDTNKKNIADDENVDDIDNLDDIDDYLLLSTIHGSKGLEWDTVFLAGCSSDIVPSFKPNIYTEEIDDIEEERRLFYVGCSRAKKYLEITLSYDYHYVTNQIYTSPFIKDIDPRLYIGSNLIFPKKINKGNVTQIINNYLLINSSSKVYPFLKKLLFCYKSYYQPFIDPLIYKNRCELIYGTFIDNLITKMVFFNFKNMVETIDVPIYEKFNMRKDKNYYNYIDPNNDWKDCLDAILRVSVKRQRLRIKYDELLKIIKSEKHFTLYKKIYDMVNTVINESLKLCKGKEKLPRSIINLHYNISFGEILGEADMVVGRTLIEFKASRECIATTKYVLQTIMYRYLLRKKDIRIDRIILMNPLLGECYTLQITPDWKDTFRVYNEIVNC